MAEQPRLIPLADPDPFRTDHLSVGRVDTRDRSRWVEDSFTTYNSPLSAAHDYVGVSLSRSLYMLFVFGLVLCFLIIFTRVIWLQLGQGDEYAYAAESNRTRHIPIVAERGLISDRHGVPFVYNTPRYSLHIYPSDIPRDDEKRVDLAERIAALMGLDVRDVIDRLNSLVYSLERDVLLYERLTQQQAIALSVASARDPALRVETGIKRTYDVFDEQISSLSHIIGYEGKIAAADAEVYKSRGYASSDYVGKQGIEASYEDELRGVKGDQVVEVSSRGTQLSVLSELAPQQGQSLTLSIDSNLQREAETVLREGMDQFDKKRGVLIVQAVQTGEILALVSLPSFSNESFAEGLSQDEFSRVIEDPNHPLVNRAVSGLYPSGSTIKPIMAIAALAEDVISPRTTIVSSGGISVGPWFFPDWRAGGHGVVDVRGAIADSVNTFFYLIGGGDAEHEGLGIDRMYHWFRLFGFGDLTGVDLGGEQVGLVPHPDWKELRKGEQWYIGDTYNLSIGQGDLLVTPLQLTNAISAIANGGSLMRPRFVRAIDNERIEPEVVTNIKTDGEVFEVVRAGMRDAVTVGSAKFLSDLPIDVAGKTGTAQWSSAQDPHAWFVGFAPYHRPEISVTVLVEEGEEGSRVAVPIAKKIFAWWHRHAYPLDS